MDKQPNWRDFQDARPSELKKTYKLTDRQLEIAYRRHMIDAPPDERRKLYDDLYRKNRSDV